VFLKHSLSSFLKHSRFLIFAWILIIVSIVLPSCIQKHQQVRLQIKIKSLPDLVSDRKTQQMLPDLKCHRLTADRWSDLEKLFGDHGACGGCWCMWWRLTRSRFIRQKREENRKALKSIVDSGKTPGILAYSNGQPIGRCAVSPREEYPALERSRLLKRIDDKPVWSVVCFFVAKPFRRKGISEKPLNSAAEFAKDQGAKIVEGYPNQPAKIQPDVFVYTGLASAFCKVGFAEIVRRSERRPIMRFMIDE
jgi:GNAT superfamily N-acetyltransferase